MIDDRLHRTRILLRSLQHQCEGTPGAACRVAHRKLTRVYDVVDVRALRLCERPFEPNPV
jgi:hypothetical protein